jgi:hypothetical protein
MVSAATELPHELQQLVGRPLPSGHFRLPSHENLLMHDAFYSAPRPAPHPVAAYAATQRGIGITVSELFQILGATIADGPLLAGCTMDFPGELRIETDYTVTGVIESIARKDTQKLGAVDFVTCRMELIDPASSDQVAIVTNVYAIPRPRQ